MEPFCPTRCWTSRFHSNHFGLVMLLFTELNAGGVNPGTAARMLVSVPPPANCCRKVWFHNASVAAPLLADDGAKPNVVVPEAVPRNSFTIGELRAKRSTSVAGYRSAKSPTPPRNTVLGRSRNGENANPTRGCQAIASRFGNTWLRPVWMDWL